MTDNDLDPDLAEAALDRAEDAYLRHLIGEIEARELREKRARQMRAFDELRDIEDELERHNHV